MISVIFWTVSIYKSSLKLYGQVVGIPMGTYCTPLVADLLMVCYEIDFMLSLSDNNQVNVILSQDI